MKFQKTINFDMYTVGDRLMDGVQMKITLGITDDDKCVFVETNFTEDDKNWLRSLGGEGAIQHWANIIKDHFDISQPYCKWNASEELAEHMTDEEYEQFEEILMRDPNPDAPTPAPKSIKAWSLQEVMDNVMSQMENPDDRTT